MPEEDKQIARWFHEHILAAYMEFIDSLKSPEIGTDRYLRAAQTAALEIWHFREQLSGALALEIEDATAMCPDYALIRDVAEIKKHRNLRRSSAQLRTPDAIKEIVVFTMYKDNLGEYYNPTKHIRLHLADGTTRDLSDVLTNGINFWCRYLAAHGISPKFPELPSLNSAEPLPRSQCPNSGPTIKMIKEFGLKGLVFEFQRFDYSTGRAEPIDLTGLKPRFRIFKPKHEIDLFLENESTGEQFKHTIVLNPDQSEQFDALKSDEERQKYLSKLPQVISAYAQLVNQVAASRKISKNTDENGSNS